MIGFLRKVMGYQPESAASKMTPKEQFASVVAAVHAILKPAGFAKQGNKFRKFYGPNVALVQFQGSQYNISTDMRFTINVAIVSAELVEHLGGLEDLKKASEVHGHFRERIGYFASPPADKWWKLNSKTDGHLISNEIVQLLEKEVLPFLDTHSSDEQLLACLKSGRGKGITRTERARYVALLDTGEPSRP